MSKVSNIAISRAQYIKLRRQTVRLRFSLMADAEIARSLPEWSEEFDRLAVDTEPEVLDLASELRRIGA